MKIKEFKNQALFGMIDGINGSAAVVVSLLISRVAAAGILAAILSKSFGSTVSMAGAEDETDDSNKRLRRERTLGMGVGYMIGSALCGMGFFINETVGIIVFSIVTTIILISIAGFKASKLGWRKSLGKTLLIFCAAVGSAFLASYLVTL